MKRPKIYGVQVAPAASGSRLHLHRYVGSRAVMTGPHCQRAASRQRQGQAISGQAPELRHPGSSWLWKL